MRTYMLEKLFVGILNMSLTACIIIPVVIALRFLLRKAPKLFSYILWSVVLFRLICPVSFSAAFSLLGAFHAPKTESGQISYISVDTAGIPAEAKDQELLAVSPVQDGAALEKTPAAEPMVSAVIIGSWIWAAGVLALLIYSVATLVKLKRKLKDAGHEQDNIYIAENLTTPFVCGFLAPKIYLPSALEGEEKAYILMHEQIHIRRCDHIVKLLGYLALCLHWFNPLVWAAFFLSGRDMEMSCDEAVIRKMGSDVKKEYSASLLNLATGRRIVGGVPLAFGEGDTGGRIKNVLRYKKPAAALICAAVIVIAAAAAVLLANPRQRGASEDTGTAGKEEQNAMEALYGIVGEYDGRYVVTIPVLGVVELSVDKVETYFEPGEDGQDLRVGDLVEISFVEGTEVQVLETYPARFSQPVEHVYIMRRGMALSYAGEDRYRISFPIGGLEVIGGEEVEAGDMLQIYRTDIYGENEEPWRMVPVLEADKEKNLVSIELSTEDTRIFLSELNNLSRTYIKVQDSGADILPENGGTDGAGQENGETGSSRQEEPVTGTVYIRMLSEEEPRAITSYAFYQDNGAPRTDTEEGAEPLVFAEDCIYKVNTAMEIITCEEVSYEAFVDTLKMDEGLFSDFVRITLVDNVIVEAVQMSRYGEYGISYFEKEPDHGYQDMLDIAGEDMLEQYYTLAGTESFDVADSDGDEQIEIYTGNIGDGDSGLVLFRNAEGSLLYTEFAHQARVGWNNVYLGEIDGTGFIMNVWIEDRDDYGQYSYCVYRLSAEGEIRQIAGSAFEWGLRTEYSDELFQEWAGSLTYYLENSRLILSSQEGEIRTEQVSEADKYNYETLSLKDRNLERIP